MRARISESIKLGSFRFRLSEPVGRGQVWGSVSTGRGPFRVRLAAPLGGKRRKRRG